MDTQVYECRQCRKRIQAQAEAVPPNCCNRPMAAVMDQCTLAAAPEHARLDDPDEPCDDGRAG
jgi:hypothetical protein